MLGNIAKFLLNLCFYLSILALIIYLGITYFFKKKSKKEGYTGPIDLEGAPINQFNNQITDIFLI